MTTLGVTVELAHIVLLEGRLSKEHALELLVEAVAQCPAIEDKGALLRAVYEREALLTTGIGGGIAIPHVRIPEVNEPTLALGIAPEGIEYNALDQKPVHLLVLFATPAGAATEYLALLAQVMRALRDHTLYKRLVASHTPEDAFQVLLG